MLACVKLVSHYCDGASRRDMLRIGPLGAGGLALHRGDFSADRGQAPVKHNTVKRQRG